MKCARCQSELSGSNFCVACGHTNEAAMLGKKTEVERKVQDRIERGKAWRRLSSKLWFLRWFIR